MDNLTAAQSGDRVRALEVLRDTLAAQLDTTDKQIHAQLAAQYRAALADIAELTGSGVSTKVGVDELQQRRSNQGRRATSDASANA